MESETSSVVDTFLAGLRHALGPDNAEAFARATGATPADLAAVQTAYPLCPDSLLELWSKVDGTYWRAYGGTTIAVLILGSDVGDYPYYLSSSAEVLEEAAKYQETIRERYGEHLEYVDVDPRIDIDLPHSEWLWFSDCMNNGGTSKLYVDFKPAAGGVVGQVVRYLHDPDSYAVIANSFDDYLQQLIDRDYSYVVEDDY